MTGKTTPSSKTADRPAADDREARLSKALRDNLRKRKAQARARIGDQKERDKGQG